MDKRSTLIDQQLVNKVQYKSLTSSSGDWTATTSYITYAPTVSGDMNANGSSPVLVEFQLHSLAAMSKPSSPTVL
ncbi:MAG: hypothetical protein JXR16_02280 [Bermanella sp.]